MDGASSDLEIFVISIFGQYFDLDEDIRSSINLLLLFIDIKELVGDF
jgi:hypothetical protein